MIRKLLLRTVYTTQYKSCTLYNRNIAYFSTKIKLNETFPTKNEHEILNKITEAYNTDGYDGIFNLAETSFNEQDLNVTALSYSKLIESYTQNDANNEYFNTMDNNAIYNIYYRFIATLHLLKDYESAKYYIEDVIIPKFGEEFDGKLYAMYALVLKEGFNDIESAEKYFFKSIDLTPGIDNLVSYLNLSAILCSKDVVDWDYVYTFSLNIMSFASFDAYVVSQHGIMCTALNKYDEAQECFDKVLAIYASVTANKDEDNAFLSYFADLSHISLRSLVHILFQYWFDNKHTDVMISYWKQFEAECACNSENNFISKYLLQFISPIVSQMYWNIKEDKESAIKLIFENNVLLSEEQYYQDLRFIHCFNYWLKLNDLSAVDVIQHSDFYPFYFGICCIINGLFEHNVAQLSCAKSAFDSIPKERVLQIYEEMEKYEQDKDAEEKKNVLILSYIQRLMNHMFNDSLNKISQIAWGQIAIYQFTEAEDIAQNILKLDKENVIAFGILCRTYTEQEEYNKAVDIFEEHITEQKCSDDEMLYFNIMPYYGIALCFDENRNESDRNKGNQIMVDLLEKAETDDKIHVIHREQIYRWFAHKLHYLDKDYASAIRFYEKSFLQNDKIKYPPLQIEIAKCYLQINDTQNAKQNIDQALENGKEIFSDYIQKQYNDITLQIQQLQHSTQ